MSGSQAKAVLKYAVMPEVLPRIRQLFVSGFGPIAYFMAQIYSMVRLLPAGHPYLNPRNIGQFGIRHVIAEAANHLTISRKNIDQIVIFLLLLCAVVLLGLMVCLLLFTLTFKYALAAAGAPGVSTSMFVTQLPANDIAFMLMDQVFGIGPQGAGAFFGSCVAQNVACFPGQTPPGGFPWPFHLALQELFKFYSSGILVIGALIFLYFIVVIVIETATTGSPFGQRFKNMWVPVRLVVAVGLLIPLNYGYNGAQYITFAAAKYGSGFATNAWNLYNNTIAAANPASSNPTGESQTLIAMPGAPDGSVFLQMMSLVHGCAFAYYYEDPNINKATVPLPNGAALIPAYMNASKVKPYLVKNVQSWMTDNAHWQLVAQGTTYNQALAFSQSGDITIRFGREVDSNRDGTIDNQDDIDPTCGDVRVNVEDRRQSGGTPYLGSVEVQRFYYELIRDLWFGGGVSGQLNDNLLQFAGRVYLLSHNNPQAASTNQTATSPCDMGTNAPGSADLPGTGASPEYVPTGPGQTGQILNRACTGQEVGAIWKLNRLVALQPIINNNILAIWNQYNASGAEFQVNANLSRYGWAGAGIWYNTIAQINGAFTSAIVSPPSLDKYPKIMEKVADLKGTRTNDPSGLSLYNPNMGDSEQSQIGQAEPLGGMAIALGLYGIHEYWNKEGANPGTTENIMSSGALENAMNFIFGTEGLFNILNQNPQVHPLSQLVALGKGLVESSIRNIAFSTMGGALGGFLGAIEKSLGPLASAATGFISSTAFIGLTAGFVLFYVLPFLPFVYFYFTVATWIKTIFEAIVGVPLWALAHLRLDGEGLPGDAASNGYFLIFEIFIRPILAIVGLIAGILIFTMQVRVLNFSWMLVTENVGGSTDRAAAVNIVGSLNINRSVIDEFFFTCLYAIIVYMMATASFKLIDRIPDNLLRWMGQGVSSFSDINSDATEGLTRYAAMGGMQVSQQLTKGMGELGSGISGATSRLLSPRAGGGGA